MLGDKWVIEREEARQCGCVVVEKEWDGQGKAEIMGVCSEELC